jgi:hypothetical protein
MAHFAQLDESNIVTQVIVVHNNELLDNGVESEAKGAAFCQSLLGGNWIQTSYNGNIRKNYAGIGFTYDQTRDAFIPPKADCHTEETLDEETCLWVCTNPEHDKKVVDSGDN